MAALRISLALGEYDRTRALLDGRVRFEDLDAQLIPMSNAFERHQRMLRDDAFDACELSLSSYIMARDSGRDLAAIAVFPYRMFRHGYVLVRADAGINRPEDLAGKRIGVAMYQITTALWIRGFLQHDYGVGPEALHWYCEMPELMPVQLGVDLRHVPAGQLEDMLVKGELDALILVEEVPRELLALAQVRRLFPDYAEVERNYYHRTGIFPIMHVLAVREPLLSQHPWLAASLREGFEQAKRRALDELRWPRTSTLVWAGAERERELEVFGDDPYPYGMESNRQTLDAALAYSHEQGLSSRRFRVEELFAQ